MPLLDLYNRYRNVISYFLGKANTATNFDVKISGQFPSHEIFNTGKRPLRVRQVTKIFRLYRICCFVDVKFREAWPQQSIHISSKAVELETSI